MHFRFCSLCFFAWFVQGVIRNMSTAKEVFTGIPPWYRRRIWTKKNDIYSDARRSLTWFYSNCAVAYCAIFKPCSNVEGEAETLYRIWNHQKTLYIDYGYFLKVKGLRHFLLLLLPFFFCIILISIVWRCLFHLSGQIVAASANKNITRKNTHTQNIQQQSSNIPLNHSEWGGKTKWKRKMNDWHIFDTLITVS